MKNAVTVTLLVLAFAGSAPAQSQNACFDATITATGRTLLTAAGATSSSRYNSASFTYRTVSSPASVSFTIEAANVPAATATPITKSTAQTTATSGAQYDIGTFAGPYRYWYANVATLPSGSIVVTTCLSAAGSALSGAFSGSTLALSSLTPGSILFAGTGGLLSQDNANFFRDTTDATNRYGLNIGSVSGATNNWNIWSAPLSASLDTTNDWAYNFTRNFFGDNGGGYSAVFHAELSGGGTAPSGAASFLITRGAGNYTSGPGGAYEGYVTHAGTGIVTTTSALQGQVSNVSTGTITSGHALIIASAANSGGGTITNNYGMFVQDQTVGANNWALKTGLGLVEFGDVTKAPLYSTTTNCADSAGAAACGAASAGAVVIDAAATSVVVSTTAVTANSQIFVQDDSSLSTRLSVTCNTQALTVLGPPRVTARTAATSFTISIDVGPTTNPLCLNFFIVN